MLLDDKRNECFHAGGILCGGEEILCWFWYWVKCISQLRFFVEIVCGNASYLAVEGKEWNSVLLFHFLDSLPCLRINGNKRHITTFSLISCFTSWILYWDVSLGIICGGASPLFFTHQRQ